MSDMVLNKPINILACATSQTENDIMPVKILYHHRYQSSFYFLFKVLTHHHTEAFKGMISECNHGNYDIVSSNFSNSNINIFSLSIRDQYFTLYHQFRHYQDNNMRQIHIANKYLALKIKFFLTVRNTYQNSLFELFLDLVA